MDNRNFSIYKTTQNRHSISFYLSILLIIFMLLAFYLNALIETNSALGFLSYIPLVCLTLFCLAICYAVFFGQKRLKGNQFLLFFFFLFFITLSYVVNFSGGSMIIGPLAILSGIYVFNLNPLHDEEKKVIFCLFSLSILLILFNGSTVENIREGKFNPNTCGFLLTMLFCVCVPRYIATRKKSIILIMFFCIGLQFVFDSRTALLGLLLYAFVCLILKASKRTFKHQTVFWVILIFSMLGLVAAYIYSEILFPLIGHGKIYIFGKDLFTGRQTIWSNAFHSIRENFWFGVGSHLNELLYDQGYSKLIMNAHNQAIGIFAAFGFLPFLLFYIVFASFASHFYKNDHVCSFRYPAIFLFVITLMSYFDIYFFAQYNWIAILIAYVLIVSHSKKCSEEKHGIYIYSNIQQSIYHREII